MLLISFKYIPNAKIDGTHKPIKVPSAFSPWKYRVSEKIKDNSAAINSSLSAKVNFLNIISFLNFLSKKLLLSLNI